VTVLTFAMGYLMGYRPGGGFIGVFEASLLMIVFAWCISWIFAFLGVISRTAASVQGISMMVLFPLTFLSNSFVPVDTLPSALKWFATANPVSHLVTAVREIANQGMFGQDFWWSLLGAIVIVAVMAPLTIQAYMRKA
jgi:ABC-2 type transport system permease protein